MKIWPATLLPQEDELLSSWLTRIAYNHYQKIYTFYKNLIPSFRIWSSDIDSNFDETLLSNLSEFTSIPIERIKQTSIKSYENNLFFKKVTSGNTKWILCLGIKNSKINRYGLMYCPGCFIKDKEKPFYRKKWRLAFSICCPDCGFLLKDRCPKCKSPIWFIRNELGKKDSMPDLKITDCSNCGHDLKKCRGQKADSNIIKFQNQLYTYLNLGHTETLNYSQLYFNGLYQIIRILNSENKEANRLREAIAKETGLIYHYEKKYIYEQFEHKQLKERHILLLMANYMLENWPVNFINICRDNRIWIKVLFRIVKDENDLPFWYWEMVIQNLNKRIIRHDFKNKLASWRQKNRTKNS